MRVLFVVIVLIFTGCSQNISRDDLRFLNGYWEIKEVKFPDGTKKEYKVNVMVDYIELEGMNGLRKKVRPKFDGTFVASEDSENFKLIKKGKGFEMYYTNKLSDWTERLKSISEDSFTVSTMDNISYTYQRFHNINVTGNGEKEK